MFGSCAYGLLFREQYFFTIGVHGSICKDYNLTPSLEYLNNYVAMLNQFGMFPRPPFSTIIPPLPPLPPLPPP